MIPNGSLSKAYQPNGVMNVVKSLDCSDKGIYQKPLLAGENSCTRQLSQDTVNWELDASPSSHCFNIHTSILTQPAFQCTRKLAWWVTFEMIRKDSILDLIFKRNRYISWGNSARGFASFNWMLYSSPNFPSPVNTLGNSFYHVVRLTVCSCTNCRALREANLANRSLTLL